ncbi:MAG: hypothetical protein V3V35_00520, partial [Dehalococcoidia bacterium]
MTTETRVKLKIVDADGHYLEPPFALPEYIEPRYRDRAPRIVRGDDGKEFWQGNGWWDDNLLISNRGSAPRRATAVAGLAGIERWNQGTDLGNVKDLNYTQMNPAATDPAARLEVMDSERMDAAVLYPTMNLQWIRDAGFHQALNRALNDWQADYIKGGGGRLYGAVNVVAVHDVQWA